MPDVNNDMDELFRRAANGYPLNTSGSDWSKISKALLQAESMEMEVNNSKVADFSTRRKKYSNILLLLMLLSIPLICVDYVVKNNYPSAKEPLRVNTGSTIDKSLKKNVHTTLKAITKKALVFNKRKKMMIIL